MNASVTAFIGEASWDDIVAQSEPIVGRRLIEPSAGLAKRLIEPQLICVGMNLVIRVSENKLEFIRKIQKRLAESTFVLSAAASASQTSS